MSNYLFTHSPATCESRRDLKLKIMPYYIKRKVKEKPAARKKRQPSLSSLVSKLDKVFSQYIRLRDAMPSGVFRCISCGQIKPISKADCGHFYSRRHMSTRFDEDNCNAECSYCNRFNAEHLKGYQDNLIRKIGLQRFELLSVRVNETKKWSCFEIETLIKHYQNKVKELEKEKGIKL